MEESLSWKELEEALRERSRAFWRPEVAQRMPNGGRIELDHDNKAYYVDHRGVRRRISELA
jgi:hypothetical protein